MHAVLQDLRYSFRQLVKMPGFTLTAILSLALGIGATTAVLSVVYAIVVNPYPYAPPIAWSTCACLIRTAQSRLRPHRRPVAAHPQIPCR